MTLSALLALGLFQPTKPLLFSYLSREEVRGWAALARRGLVAMCETPKGWCVWRMGGPV